MLAEVISFGGRCKDVRSIVAERIRRQVNSDRRKENVRLKLESDEKTVVVQVKVKQRDGDEKVDELNEVTGKPTGRKIDNPRYGKFYYTSHDAFEVEQADPKEVFAVVKEAVIKASKK